MHKGSKSLVVEGVNIDIATPEHTIQTVRNVSKRLVTFPTGC
ncbi:hypothetical protein [Brevibacillus nitrificans]|nr:hypothetical protein [Brevibacillus nitrificans]